MRKIHSGSAVILLALAGAVGAYPIADEQPMTFFVTSVGPGNGGDLSGLAGADRHCDMLARAVGASDRTWRAYLSTQATDGQPAVHARERIGRGPWHNAAGVLIAANVADLHGDIERDRNNLAKDNALDERGEVVSGRGDPQNRHDILTGSTSHGTAFPPELGDRTCRNWTSSSDDARAQVGHHDRLGGANTSWNSVHASRGCSQDALRSTGGDGLFYCFASD